MGGSQGQPEEPGRRPAAAPGNNAEAKAGADDDEAEQPEQPVASHSSATDQQPQQQQQQQQQGEEGAGGDDTEVTLDSLSTSGLAKTSTTPARDYALPVVSTFKDHFSLQVPTSRIRYRAGDGISDRRGGDSSSTSGGGACRIIQIDDAQIVLEETSREVSIRKIHDTSEGVRALRVLYAIVVRCVVEVPSSFFRFLCQRSIPSAQPLLSPTSSPHVGK